MTVLAEILTLPSGEDARAFARQFLDSRFEDVRDSLDGGWSALCPLCDAEARVAIGRDLVVQPCPNGHTSGQVMDATGPRAEAVDALERIRSLEGATLAELELLELAAPAWLVEGFIEQEAFGVLFGPPNAGKTFFAIHVICMAAARKWRVKFIEAEGGLFHLRKRLLRAAASIDGVVRENINVSWSAPLDISKDKGATALRDAIRGYDLAVLDSMAALSGGVSENEEEWTRVSNNLAWARSLTSCSILGVHHAVKEAWKPGETPELRHLRGHGALAGRADFALGVVPGPEESGRVVFDLHDLKERESGKPPPRRCRVDMVSEAAHFSMEEITEEQATAPAKAPAAKAVDGIADRLLKSVYIPTSKETAIAAGAMAKIIKASRPNTIAAVKLLHRQELFGKVPQKPFDLFFRLPGETDE